jgi:hypothetical protein
MGTFDVDANGEVTSGLNHEGESTEATSRDGMPRSSFSNSSIDCRSSPAAPWLLFSLHVYDENDRDHSPRHPDWLWRRSGAR